MVLTPLIRGLFGIEVDAPTRRLTIAPHLPPDWDSVRVRNVGLGVSMVLRRTARGIRAELTRPVGDAPVDVVFSPALPLGASVQGAIIHTPGDVHTTVHGVLRDSLTLEVPYTGGVRILPPRNAVAIGDRSGAARVLSERLGGGRYTAMLQGRAGGTYVFRVAIRHALTDE